MKRLFLCILLFLFSCSVYAQQACPGTSNTTQGYMIFVVKGNVISNTQLFNGLVVVTLDTNNGKTFDLITIVCSSNISSQCLSLSFAQTVEFSGEILPQECSTSVPTQHIRFRAYQLDIL